MITPEGRARLRSAAPVHLLDVERHFGRHLTDDEAELIADVLGRVLGDVCPDMAARLSGLTSKAKAN